MLISSWVKLMSEAVASWNTPSRRRRKHSSRISGNTCQVEHLESRSMLSAGPIVTLASPGPLTFTENSSPIPVASGATVTDAGVANFSGGKLTESITANAGATDRLAIMNQGNAAGQIGLSGTTVEYGGVPIGTFSGGTGSTPLVVNLNANATVPAVQALQGAITFPTGDNPASMLPRTFQSVVTDGPVGVGNASAPVTERINIVESNPIVKLNVGNETVHNSAAMVIAPKASITSAEIHDLSGGKLTISLTNATSRDRLTIGAPGIHKSGGVSVSGNKVLVDHVVVGTFSGGHGTKPLVVTFNSKATVADAQAIARNITFRSIGHFNHVTDVQFRLTDGDGGTSNIAKTTVTITHGKHNGDGNGNGDNDDDRHGLGGDADDM